MEGMSAWASKPSLDSDAVGEGAETGSDGARGNVRARVAGTFCILICVCVRVSVRACVCMRVCSLHVALPVHFCAQTMSCRVAKTHRVSYSVCCSVLQCVTVCRSVSHCVAVCSVL